MEIRDFFLGPLYAVLIIFIALLLRKKLTNKATSPHYFPALFLKLFGALVFGLIYQFYYGGGDTFDYFKGGGIFWDSLFDNPSITWLLFYFLEKVFCGYLD